MSDLDQLREVGQLLRQPAFEELLETRRRRTRRARIVTASALAVAATGAVVALAATGNNLRTDPSPVGPSPTPTPTETFRIPAGQQTITSDLGPGEVHGYDVLATVTNTQPGNRGASELSATVPDSGSAAAVSTYCRGGSDLWFFYDVGEGGGGFDRCSPDADTTLAPSFDIDELAWDEPGGGTRTVRMWIARPSAVLLDCLHSRSGDCPSVSDVPPVVDPDAEFGFRIYDHVPELAFDLLEDMGNGEPYPLEALSTLDGVGWRVDHAVTAAPGADRLAFELSASDSEYLLDVYTGKGPHFERCTVQHGDDLPDWESTDHNVYAAAVDKVCGADLRLVVDGTRVTPDKDPKAAGHFMELGAGLEPGTGHQIEVEVVRGDPHNIQYAVVVRTRTRIP
jgi:hypothetical protein